MFPAQLINNQSTFSEFLLLLEKHREADNSSVDKESSKDRHYHRGDLNRAAVGEDSWEG